MDDRPGRASAANPTKWACILRGLGQRCPRCGQGRLLHNYLRTVSECGQCGEPFGHIRADDFPPYLTIVIVGHVIVPLVLLARGLDLSMAMEIALWVPATLVLTLLTLPRCKGAVIGLMWSLGLSGSETQ